MEFVDPKSFIGKKVQVESIKLFGVVNGVVADYLCGVLILHFPALGVVGVLTEDIISLRVQK